MRNINIGLTAEQRQGVIDLLNHDVADAYLLLIKTKKFHWDVVGVMQRNAKFTVAVALNPMQSLNFKH